MTRDDAIQLFQEAARKAREGEHGGAEMHLLQVLAWVPRTIEQHGLTYTAGVINGIFSSINHITSNDEISSVYFMLAEALKHDSPLPGEQIKAAAAALSKLGEAPVEV